MFVVCEILKAELTSKQSLSLLPGWLHLLIQFITCPISHFVRCLVLPLFCLQLKKPMRWEENVWLSCHWVIDATDDSWLWKQGKQRNFSTPIQQWDSCFHISCGWKLDFHLQWFFSPFNSKINLIYPEETAGSILLQKLNRYAHWLYHSVIPGASQQHWPADILVW